MEKMAPKARHNVDFGYWIMMNNTGILAIKSRYTESLINDVTEIKLHSDIMNWEHRFSLSKTHNTYPFPRKNKVTGIQKRERSPYFSTNTHRNKVCQRPLPSPRAPRASFFYSKTQ